MDYRAESNELDAEVLGIIERWRKTGEPPGEERFNALALRLFDYQLRYNGPYARYCKRLGVTAPRSWDEIPGVPAAAFKEAALATFDPASAALAFETSGTTAGTAGRHFMETPVLYDAALLGAFDRYVLAGARLRYFNLVPDPAQRPQSSLGYMMARISERRGAGRTGWYLRGDELLVDEFIADVGDTISAGQPICVAATAFALVALLDALEKRRIELAVPEGSLVMQTGGFKGRSRVVERGELFARIARTFGIESKAIVSEYGMTELSSQYYATGDGAYAAPPWLRARVVGPDRASLAPGTAGSLLHLDLANRSSCIAIQTEDFGMQTPDGLRLLGREGEASLRGCSLDAEALRA